MRPRKRLSVGQLIVRHLRISAVALLIVLGGILLLYTAKWPFTQDAIIHSLEQVSSSDVRIGHFRKTFFPRPGYIAENVIFSRSSPAGTPPLVGIRRIICRASWVALVSFTHRIKTIELEACHIYIPAPVPPPVRRFGPPMIRTTVTTLIADRTVLEIASHHPGGQTLRFDFARLTVRELAHDKPMKFDAVFQNPNPPGEMTASGTFGPLITGKVGQTPISGSFRLRNADLSPYKVIAGSLSAKGRFDGTLARAETAGHVQIPNFEVTRSRHSLGISTEYHAIVDGTKGDVTIESVQAHFLQTTLTAHGSIRGQQGKTVSLDFDSNTGRVQDVLRPFIQSDQCPLNGAITLNAHVVLPPSHQPFLKRVQLDGNFAITDAEFTNPTTEEKVDELSARARGQKREIKSKNGPERVTSILRASAHVRHALAALSAGVFAVPGAVARGGGTYDLSSEAVDLRGQVAMHASLSQAAGGIKSILLLPLDPFFKKNAAGAVVGFRMSGTYSHPIFKVSLSHRK